jgi:hypothetical protein
MMAICPAGPPKLISPSFSQNLSASRNDGMAQGVAAFCCQLRIGKWLGLLGSQ